MSDFFELLGIIVIAAPFVLIGGLVLLGLFRCFFKPKLWAEAFPQRSGRVKESVHEKDDKLWLSGHADPGIRAAYGDTDP